MKKYTVKLTKEHLEESKFIYPLFKKWKDSGEIVKFIFITGGITVWKGNNKHNKVGYISYTRVKHTDDRWEDIAYDFKKNLWDGQPIKCWNNKNAHEKYIGFYDVKNKTIYNYDYEGKKIKWIFDNHKALPFYRYNEWIIEAYKTLEK